MRTFDHFPEDKTCPLCGKNTDEVCILTPIDGTERDNICEAAPTHLRCFNDLADQFRLNREADIVYIKIAEGA